MTRKLPCSIEIAIYPELRAAEHAVRDLLLVYLVCFEMQNVGTLRGQYRTCPVRFSHSPFIFPGVAR